MKKKIIVFAPLSSGHVQKWLKSFYHKYEFVFCTLHKHDDFIFPDSKVYSFPRVTGTRFDFFISIIY
ncbi:hypothetical protein, partial [Photobacterium sp. GB-1]|uniref:hypothetical protein n=1 Tax=Photobacterium sp. GB-1 TaxID=2022111 RepID=UPI001E63DA2D